MLSSWAWATPRASLTLGGVWTSCLRRMRSLLGSIFTGWAGGTLVVSLTTAFLAAAFLQAGLGAGGWGAVAALPGCCDGAPLAGAFSVGAVGMVSFCVFCFLITDFFPPDAFFPRFPCFAFLGCFFFTLRAGFDLTLPFLDTSTGCCFAAAVASRWVSPICPGNTCVFCLLRILSCGVDRPESSTEGRGNFRAAASCSSVAGMVEAWLIPPTVK